MEKLYMLNKTIRIPLVILIVIIIASVMIITGVLGKNIITSAAKSMAATALNTEDGMYEYVINEDGETITINEYMGTEENLVIPSEIDGYTVTGFGDGKTIKSALRNFEYYDYAVFRYGWCINTIKLPSTLVSIGTLAFKGCENLISIEIEEGLCEIGNQAFSSC